MADATMIGWCDATFNPWWGCERVSPGCANCYAATFAKRVGKTGLWTKTLGQHGFRFFADKHWAEPLKWAKHATEGRLPNGTPNPDGHRPRVFCASMADVFEPRAELDEQRERLFELIEETPALDWLLLTKRPQEAVEWARDFYDAALPAMAAYVRPCPNIWLGTSIENARFIERADTLREIPAAVHFISAEPLLGSLFTAKRSLELRHIEWLIVGGESGGKRRPMQAEWARELREAARAAGAAFFYKQGSALHPGRDTLLDGQAWSEFPRTLEASHA